jgi:hypothetical protein
MNQEGKELISRGVSVFDMAVFLFGLGFHLFTVYLKTLPVAQDT